MLGSQSSGQFQFSELGLTNAIVGSTMRTTLYDTFTGATFNSFVVPSPVNYVLGSDLAQTLVGSSFITFTRGTLSLTTNGRPVEISLTPDTSNGYMEFDATQFQNCVGQIRLLRGPSTIIGILSHMSEHIGSTDAYVSRLPCSSFKFLDLNAPVGAATYILQGNAIGTSSQIIANGALMFVRQT